MRFWMRIATPFTLMMCLATGAQANGGMWGTGMYGGMQACPYNYGAAEGSSSYLDEIKEAQESIQEAQKQLRAKKSELKKVNDAMNKKYRRSVEGVISEEFSSVVFDHIEGNYTCKEYKGLADMNAPEVQGKQGDTQITGTAATRELPDTSFKLEEWSALCDKNRAGTVSGAVCDGNRFRKSEKGRYTSKDCKEGLVEYKKAWVQSNNLKKEIEYLETSIKQAKEDIKDSRKNYAEEQRERRREVLEGGVCVECMAQGSGYTYQRPETNWGSVAGNVALGIGSLLVGYRTNKMIANANANIGWPTDPYASVGYGYGLGAIGTALDQSINGGSGIYGAIGGGIGAGAFGCAGNNGGPYGMMGPYGGMNGNGIWGNPYAMGGLGLGGNGGIYLPGMGPWGMAGPWGMGGPYGGGMGFPMSGGGMGYPMGMAGVGGLGLAGGLGMPMMGMPGGMAGGMGYPMGMAGGMGYPMGMAGVGGLGLAGGLGMPMMGMPGGMAGGMGYPMGMAGAGGLGMPMMGMPGGMGAMGGMGMPMMGMPGGMGMPANGLGSLQMQQQMMQMQMQQYQMYIQQQQSYMQQQMQRQQVVASLQQELYGLLYRIQQVQMGVGGAGYIGGSIGVGNGTTGVGTGITPLPGGSGLPGSGSGAAPIPAPR